MSVVRYLILIVVKVKQSSERSQRFPFNSSEINQRSGVLSEEKQRSDRSQIFHFRTRERNSVVSEVRGFLLIIIN